MMDNDIVIELGRIATEGYYDYQEIRITQNNRIRDIIRRKLEGIPMDTPESKKENKDYIKKYTDTQIKKLLNTMLSENKISEHEHYYLTHLINLAGETEKTENQYKSLMNQYISREPIWTEWLQHIKGISTILTSNLLKTFGYCENFKYVSSLWRYCGLDPDGAKGRRHGEKIHYNPKAKTLSWKIADSFIKQRTQPYRQIYDTEKQRQLTLMEQNAPNAPKNKLHADLRARRKMVKIFYQHYYVVAKTLKNLPVTKPYQHVKLGHTNLIPPPHFNIEKIKYEDTR